MNFQQQLFEHVQKEPNQAPFKDLKGYLTGTPNYEEIHNQLTILLLRNDIDRDYYLHAHQITDKLAAEQLANLFRKPEKSNIWLIVIMIIIVLIIIFYFHESIYDFIDKKIIALKK